MLWYARFTEKAGARWPVFAPLAAVLLWGGVYPAAKLGLRDMPVLSFTAIRLLLAVTLLYSLGWRGRSPSLGGCSWAMVCRAGVAQAVFQGFLLLGLHHTTASNSAILLATTPLLTALWLQLTGQRRLSRQQWGGLLLGLFGVGCIVQNTAGTWTGTRLWGDLCALGAAGAWGWYGFAVAPLVGFLGPIRATAWTIGSAAACFIPLALVEAAGYAWTQVSWHAWAGLVYTATGGMVAAMSLWGFAVHRLGPQTVMVYVYLEPVAAVALAALVLGEALHPFQAWGAVLTLAGVWWASRTPGS